MRAVFNLPATGRRGTVARRAPLHAALTALALSIPVAPAGAGPIGVLGSTVLNEADLPAAARDRSVALRAEHERQRREHELDFRLSEYDALVSDTQRMLNERVLAMESGHLHSTPEKLLERVPFEHTGADEARTLYQQHAREIGQPFEAVEAAIVAELDRQKREVAQADYLAKLRTRYGARVTVEPPRFSVTADGPSIGPDGAPVTLVLFADFQCPYCAQLVPELRKLLQQYPTQVRLVYRHLPLTTLHPLAYGAAQGGVCAAAQDRFWPYYDAVYANKAALAPAALRDTVAQLGLDLGAYDACVTAPETSARIAADVAVADDLGLSGTPALFVNGRLVRGLQPVPVIASIVDDELGRTKRRP